MLEEVIDIKHSAIFRGSVVSREKGIMLKSLSQIGSMVSRDKFTEISSAEGVKNYSTVYQHVLGLSGRIESQKLGLSGRMDSQKNEVSRRSK